jgi:hypothetical protein
LVSRFCIKCKSIIDQEEAAVTFKTGYYKNTIPLALCRSCLIESSSRASISEQAEKQR